MNFREQKHQGHYFFLSLFGCSWYVPLADRFRAWRPPGELSRPLVVLVLLLLLLRLLLLHPRLLLYLRRRHRCPRP